MIESLLLLFLIGLGIFLSVVLLVLAIIGFALSSSIIKKISFYGSILPGFCFGSVALFYMVIIPSQNKSQMQELSGVYTHSTHNEVKIMLHNDGTYKTHNSTMLKLQLGESGTWKTGGIDGQINFYNSNGNFIHWANPSNFENSGTILEFSNQEVFQRFKN